MPRSRKSDRVEQVYSAIRSAIFERALEPGCKLPEDTIGEQFGVSRTIVRYVLNQLAMEGLVVLQRNRSAIVAQPSWEDAQATFDIRTNVEKLVVQRLIGTLTEDQITELKAHVQQEEDARDSGKVNSIQLASAFHTKLAEMTESEVLIHATREFSSRCTLILTLFSRPHSAECGVDEHREIVELLAKGEEAKAVEAMASHLHAVAARALVTPQRKKGRNIAEILAPYAADVSDEPGR